MKNLFLRLFAVPLTASALLTFAVPAQAQSLDFFNGGSIQMGANGPVGVLGNTVLGGNSGQFSTGLGNVTYGSNGVSGTFNTGAVNGRVNVGSNGVYANTNQGSYGFDWGSNNNTGNNGYSMGGQQSGYGPQGQSMSGYSNGAGSFGTAYSSQGDTGSFGRESGTTNNFHSTAPVTYTGKNNQTRQPIQQQTNLLSTFSVDPSGVRSGKWKYGFNSSPSISTGAVQFLRRGWVLPPTSTSSVDINTWSP